MMEALDEMERNNEETEKKGSQKIYKEKKSEQEEDRNKLYSIKFRRNVQ